MLDNRSLLDLTVSEFDAKIDDRLKNIPHDFFDASWDRKAGKLMEELTGKDVNDAKSRLCIRKNHDFAQGLRLDTEDLKKQTKNKIFDRGLTAVFFILGYVTLEFLKGAIKF